MPKTPFLQASRQMQVLGSGNERYQPFTGSMGTALTVGWTFANQYEFSVFAGYIPREEEIQYEQIPLMLVFAENFNIGRVTSNPASASARA